MTPEIADILFLASDPRELAPFLRRCTAVRPVAPSVHWARRAQWKGRSIAAVANGAGPRRAALAAAAVPHRILCNLGFCGALDPALRVGDIVVPEHVLQPRTTAAFTRARLVTVDHVVSTAREKSALSAAGGAIVDMEAGGLTPPFYSVKAVSDLAGETFDNHFNDALLPDGKFSISRLLLGALQSPLTRFPELIRLSRRTTLASENLGAFLDTCDF